MLDFNLSGTSLIHCPEPGRATCINRCRHEWGIVSADDEAELPGRPLPGRSQGATEKKFGNCFGFLPVPDALATGRGESGAVRSSDLLSDIILSSDERDEGVLS